jgi:hypothetical protein
MSQAMVCARATAGVSPAFVGKHGLMEQLNQSSMTACNLNQTFAASRSMTALGRPATSVE